MTGGEDRRPLRSAVAVAKAEDGRPPLPADTIRLIAVDIDGTLLDSRGDLPDANRLAIRAAMTRDVEVVLATGRTFHHARPVAMRLGGDLTLIVSNGALVKTSHGATLGQPADSASARRRPDQRHPTDTNGRRSDL